MPTLHYSRVVELSHPLQPEMPTWPGDPPTQFTPLASIPKQGFFLRGLSLGEHSGTHLNAPAHFFEDGPSVDAIPAGRLVLPAALIDARPQCARDPDYALTVPDLLAWEKNHGPFPSGCLASSLPAGRRAGPIRFASLTPIRPAACTSLVLAWMPPTCCWKRAARPGWAAMPTGLSRAWTRASASTALRWPAPRWSWKTWRISTSCLPWAPR